MRTSTALRKTKEKLWDGVASNHREKTAMCCLAARLAGVHCQVGHIFMQLLDGEASLSAWLVIRCGIHVGYDRRRLQLTRHAWVDHLIEHYESIGD